MLLYAKENSSVSYANNESASDFTPTTAGIEDDNSAYSQIMHFMPKVCSDKKTNLKF
jgi:hypothetical protein